MTGVSPTIEMLISDFYQRTEFDVDIQVSVDKGVVYAVGGDRKTPQFTAYQNHPPTIDRNFMSQFLQMLVDADPDVSVRDALSPCALQWLDDNPGKIVYGVFAAQFEDKSVRVDYQATKEIEGQYLIHLRLTMQDKNPPILDGEAKVMERE